MPTNSPYGGVPTTLPTDVGPTPFPTTTTTVAPARPSTGLAFTGTDLIGTLVILATLLIILGATLRSTARLAIRGGDPLVVPGYGGTDYAPEEGSEA